LFLKAIFDYLLIFFLFSWKFWNQTYFGNLYLLSYRSKLSTCTNLLSRPKYGLGCCLDYKGSTCVVPHFGPIILLSVICWFSIKKLQGKKKTLTFAFFLVFHKGWDGGFFCHIFCIMFLMDLRFITKVYKTNSHLL